MNIMRTSPTGASMKKTTTFEDGKARAKPRGGRGGRGGSNAKRVSLDDERKRKNRKLIDGYLRRISSTVGRDLSLNSDGLCYFPYKKFIVVVEVPADHVDTCFIYTMVCRLAKGDNKVEVMRLAMELNYMQYGTRGATLGLEGEEVNLCFSTRISGMSQHDLCSMLESFMLAAVEVNKKLDVAKLVPHTYTKMA